MRIGIDLRLLSAGRLAVHRGVGRYTQSQVAAVLRHASEHRPSHRFVLFCRRDADFAALAPAILAAPQVEIAELPALGGRCGHDLNRAEAVLRETEILRRAIERQRLDVFHLTSPALREDLVPFQLDGPLVATHYDLIPWVYAEHYLAESHERELYERALRLVRRADRMVAISRFVGQEASSALGIADSRIHVAPPTVAACFRPLPLAERDRIAAPLRRRLDLPAGFALTVSHVHHAKNLPGLLAAFGLLSPDERRRLPLVLVCELSDHDLARVRAHARRHGVERDLRIAGFLSDEELAALYGAATVYVHASLYEGFGLPVLEAMRCGAPIVAARAAALPELVADAGILVDPTRPEELAGAVAALLSDPDRCRELGERSLARAALFGEEDLGRQTLAAYEGAASGRSDGAARRLRLAMWSPVPPQRSGIADYTVELVRQMNAWAEVEIFVDDGVLPDPELAELSPIRLFTAFTRRHRNRPFDAAIYQLGASIEHVYIAEALRQRPPLPAVAALHDLHWGALLHRVASLTGNEAGFRRDLEAGEGAGVAARYRAIADGEPARLGERLEELFDEEPGLGAVVAVTQAQIVHFGAAATSLGRRYPSANVAVIPMGVEDPRLALPPGGANDLRSRLEIPDHAFVLGAFGHIHPVKRIEVVIRALARLVAKERRCDPRLLVVGSVGEPAHGRSLAALASSLGVRERVHFLGRTSRRDFDLALLASDVVLNLRHPFRPQMSATLLRALAAGRPVVISDVAAWNEVPVSCCFRVAPGAGEVAAIAGHLTELARQPEARAARGEAARRHWAAQATPFHMAEGYRRVLAGILGRRIEERER